MINKLLIIIKVIIMKIIQVFKVISLYFFKKLIHIKVYL